MSNTFEGFPKIHRLSRECVITEKIDGTNAQIFIHSRANIDEGHGIPFLGAVGDFDIAAGSRNRWLTPGNDNYGFAKWVAANAEQLIRLGPGRHFGEWWGAGIQRRYNQTEKIFSLFNVHRWFDPVRTSIDEIPGEGRCECPPCCRVVPVLNRSIFSTLNIELILSILKEGGSIAAPGFMQPEGIVIYHTASQTLFKKTIESDEQGKPV